MDNSISIGSQSRSVVLDQTAALPWYCYVMVFGAACIPIGALWDISWHSTIGRDTFWTPAHITTYLGGLLPGLTCGWLALKTHFYGTEQERARAVGFWGFRAPLGAWVTIWGAFTMLLSAPFDNWWHNAYGLDVQILSPPHAVLATGMFAVAVGVLLVMLSLQNFSSDVGKGERWLFIFVVGVLLLMAAIFLTERSFPNLQHSSSFYRMSCLTYPLYLAAAARASKLRWPATIAAAIYMGLLLLMIWILPLFPAQPKLAPIYNPVDHMVPPTFPLLLIVPAIAIDLLVHWLSSKPDWLRDSLLAILLGIAFLTLFFATQWFFSKFLLSPAADNWFFSGSRFWPYTSTPGNWQHEFWENRPSRSDPVTLPTLVIALALGIVSARIGLAFGTWMSRVRR
jgi:hypothetical protein